MGRVRRRGLAGAGVTLGWPSPSPPSPCLFHVSQDPSYCSSIMPAWPPSRLPPWCHGLQIQTFWDRVPKSNAFCCTLPCSRCLFTAIEQQLRQERCTIWLSRCKTEKQAPKSGTVSRGSLMMNHKNFQVNSKLCHADKADRD